MKKLEYLKLAITQTKLYNEKSWLLNMFAIVMPTSNTKSDADYTKYELVKTHTGITFVDFDKDNKLIFTPIDDYVKNTALFNINDVIQIDPSYGVNITSALTTKLGNLIINKICVEPSFGKKMPFQNGRLSVNTFESIIAPKLKDTPDLRTITEDISKAKSDEYFYVDEFVAFADRLYFLTNLADIFNLTATPKNITAPPDINKQKAQIFEKYKDTINDPVVLASFEKELTNIDDEYLKDDPSNGIFIEGKIKNIARKKMFLNFGSEITFKNSTEVNPVINSLEEGWDTSDNKFQEHMNSLRAASYSRGVETVKGGVVAKTITRGFSSLTVVDQDCGVKYGLVRTITKDNYAKLLGRYIKVNNAWIKIINTDEAKQHIGKNIEMRSAMYCKSKRNTYCSYCLSDSYANNPNAITITGLEISSVVLGQSMKAMHAQVLKTAKVELEDICN